MKLKIVAAALVASAVLAGVASAAGVLGHEDPRLDRLGARQAALEARLRERAAGGPSASASLARVHRGRRGPRGPRGPQGPAGPPGPQGAFGSITQVTGPPAFLCSFEAGACAVASTRAECPPGTTLVGGGYTGAGILTTVTWSSPVGNSWGIIAVNLDEVSVPSLKATALCAGG